MIEFGVLVLMGVAAVAAVMAVTTVVKALLWIVLLPVRIVISIVGAALLIPFLLLKFLFGGLLFLIALPVIVVSVLAALAAAAVAVLVPALPLVLLAALVYYLVRPQPQVLARG